uniref:Uncharacterized protein n=1 Tax=Arundo donax TaxID=35708 RepID=A0A0A9AC15_ARUDO
MIDTCTCRHTTNLKLHSTQHARRQQATSGTTYKLHTYTHTVSRLALSLLLLITC